MAASLRLRNHHASDTEASYGARALIQNMRNIDEFKTQRPCASTDQLPLAKKQKETRREAGHHTICERDRLCITAGTEGKGNNDGGRGS